MKVRIGRTPDGTAVRLDTAATSVLVLVGDPARGKTTLARYVARWWIADPTRSAGAFADQPHQYADLAIQARPLGDLTTAAVAVDVRQLTIIDGADNVAIETVLAHANGSGLTIVTSFGPAARAFDGTGHPCLGLLAREPRIGRRWPTTGGHRETDSVQGRLDWPIDVVAVVPDPRGERDFPVHRWQVVEMAAS